MQPRRTRLTGAAARLLSLVVDLGHVESAEADQLALALSEMASPSGRIARDEVRRLVAAHLWDDPEMEDNTSPLAQDWALLFG
ncbi:MAG: hypothetical protein KC912_10340 [Proteobacteria bacterium]|nr:hypothetical protein [Pseudomonadota bacterium]